MEVRATSHTRPRARDHYTSSTLIGGKGGAGPSSLLHTTLEGPTEYVNARWMWGLHGFLHGIEWITVHAHLDYFQKPSLEGRSNTDPGDHGTLNARNWWFVLFYHVWGPAWIDVHWNSIWLRVRDHTTWWFWRCTCWDGLLDTFFWALTFLWKWLLAHLWSGPKFRATLRPYLGIFIGLHML